MRNPLSFESLFLLQIICHFPTCFQYFLSLLSEVWLLCVLACISLDSYSVWVCSAFWICRFVCFAQFGKCSAVQSSYTLSAPYSFSSFSETLMIWIMHLLLLVLSPWGSVHFFQYLSYLWFRLVNFYCSAFKLTDFLPPSYLFCC